MDKPLLDIVQKTLGIGFLSLYKYMRVFVLYIVVSTMVADAWLTGSPQTFRRQSVQRSLAAPDCPPIRQRHWSETPTTPTFYNIGGVRTRFTTRSLRRRPLTRCDAKDPSRKRRRRSEIDDDDSRRSNDEDSSERLGSRVKRLFTREPTPIPEPVQPEKSSGGLFRNLFPKSGNDVVEREVARQNSKRQKTDPKKTISVSKRVSKSQSLTKASNVRQRESKESQSSVDGFLAGTAGRWQSLFNYTDTKKATPGADEDSDDSKKSAMTRILGVFSSRNNTSSSDENVVALGGKNSTNPLSVLQNYIQSFSFGGDGSDGTGGKSKGADEEWFDVFPKTRISPGEMVPVTVAGLDLLVIAAADGRTLYCLANSCPHLGTPLETGKLVRLPVEESTTNSIESYSETDVSNNKGPDSGFFTELEVSSILQKDGCEDCIVCPLHKTAFALGSGQVRGEWCPYPPILGKIVGAVKPPTAAAVFDVRTRGKNVQVRLNTPLLQLGRPDRQQ